MNLEQLRARLADIKAKIDGIAPGADGFTTEQLADVDALSAEHDGISAQIEAALKVEKMKAAAPSAGRQTTSAPVSGTVPRVEVIEKKVAGFGSAGAFFMAVKNAAHNDVDPKLRALQQEKVGEDGGFLVPEEISQSIDASLNDPQESFLAKTRSFNVSGNSLSLPVDENQPWNQGVQAKWVGEGAQGTETSNTLKMAEWKLKKLMALVPVTEEMLEDSTAIESWIKTAAPAAIVSAINDAIISGNGVGKPKGILSSGFLITQAKESMQTADTINKDNIIKMYSRLLPKARAGAAWYINAGCEAQLMGMTDADGRLIFISPGQAINGSPFATLLGLPVIPMMSALPALGDVGDILLANLNYYYSIKKTSGVKQSMSQHVYFDRDKSLFKFTFRVDGSCPFTAPVAAQYGSHTASAFVALEAR